MVITTPDLSAGFQLAGVETFVAANVGEAETILDELMAGRGASLILVRRSLLAGMNLHLHRRIAASYQPLVMALPGGAPTASRQGQRHYVTELIRQTVGFQISFDKKAGEQA